MEACSWDWGAIATLIGALVALYISWQWRKQKCNEVIATECREVIGILLANIASLNHAKDMYNLAQKKDLLIEFKSSYLNILSRILLLNITIKNTDNTALPLITSYLKLLDDFQIEIQNTEPEIQEIFLRISKQKTKEQSFNDDVEQIRLCTNRFVEHVHPYSIYKKLV
ncbi:hypothetical protein [Acinetobacter sp. DSM 11652]|uniref:hypothetical protein n=1 Tax=Acinetobacter sp. DSM 11652 TaxID=346222 RepID=UPI0008BC181E|nr:hypothetical protein [Acinetobacter sp. DSM 11652]SEL33849.1 hypothetical protein SAMN05216500_101437 [Acinetobacter sp. DSM 11652]